MRLNPDAESVCRKSYGRTEQLSLSQLLGKTKWLNERTGKCNWGEGAGRLRKMENLANWQMLDKFEKLTKNGISGQNERLINRKRLGERIKSNNVNKGWQKRNNRHIRKKSGKKGKSGKQNVKHVSCRVRDLFVKLTCSRWNKNKKGQQIYPE